MGLFSKKINEDVKAIEIKFLNEWDIEQYGKDKLWLLRQDESEDWVLLYGDNEEKISFFSESQILYMIENKDIRTYKYSE